MTGVTLMADLGDLLEKTSRTFALSIPVLPEPTRREVMIAYLLFRIADTFEDAAHWEPEARIAALADFNGLLRSDYSRERAETLSRDWVAREVAHHAGYQELMAEVPFVLDAFFALSPGAIEPDPHARHPFRRRHGRRSWRTRATAT